MSREPHQELPEKLRDLLRGVGEELSVGRPPGDRLGQAIADLDQLDAEAATWAANQIVLEANLYRWRRPRPGTLSTGSERTPFEWLLIDPRLARLFIFHGDGYVREAEAIRTSVIAAVANAGDAARGPSGPKRNPNSKAERARSWFVTSYPLLGALAATFEIVEDSAACEREDIAIAAVDSELRRVYINPKFPFTYKGMQFVMAHELLHVGLRHEARRQGRDPYLWNVACDYVINGWLVEMGIGEMPTDTLLLDPELGFEKEAAEAIYDRITSDLRLIRRLNKARTLRGQGKVDVLGDRPSAWWSGPGTDLDAFYRRALAEGLYLIGVTCQEEHNRQSDFKPPICSIPTEAPPLPNSARQKMPHARQNLPPGPAPHRKPTDNPR